MLPRRSTERSAVLALLALTALLAALLVACGDDDADSGDSATTSAAPATSAAPESEAAPASEATAAASEPASEPASETAEASSEAPPESSAAPIEGGDLEVWLGGILATATPDSPVRAWYDDQVAAFEAAYPGTKIKTVLMDPDGVKQTAAFRAAFGARKGPDVAMMYPGGFTTTFASSLQNLREVAPDLVARIPEGQLRYGCPGFDCSGDAPAFVAPHDFSGWVLAYNKEIFDKVGITAPFASWSELVAAGQKLKDAGYTPFQIGNRDGYVADAYLSAMETSYLTPEDVNALLAGQLPLTDPKFVEPLRVWAQLYSYGLMNENACTLETIASQRDFLAGKAATVASFDYSSLYKELGDKLGVMAWPAVDGAPNAANAGTAAQVGQGWVVTKLAENAPLAVAFVDQITSAEAQSAGFSSAGQPPASPDADLSSPPDPAAAEASKLFLGFKLPSINTVLPLETQVTYFKETALALCGKKSPEDAMAAVQKTFERERGS